MHIPGISNQTQAHPPSGSPDGGQFTRTSQAGSIGVQELDVAQDPAADAPPTDPHELIAFHDQQRETDSAQLDELWKTGCGTGQFETYEQAKDDFNGDEFRRYQDLARAVRGAPTSAATKAGG